MRLVRGSKQFPIFGDLDARKFRRAEVWKLASVVVEVVMVWAGWVCFGSGLMRICACFFFLFFIFLRGFDRSRLRVVG